MPIAEHLIVTYLKPEVNHLIPRAKAKPPETNSELN